MSIPTGLVLPAPPGGDQMEWVETYVPISTGPAAITATVIYLARMRFARSWTINELALQVGNPSGNVDVGVWTYNPTTDTGTLAGSSGSTACVVSANMQMITIPTPIRVFAGIDYLFGAQADNSVLTLQRVSNLQNLAYKKRATTITKAFGLAANAATITPLTASTALVWIGAA